MQRCRCQSSAAADRTLPELPQVGNLPHLPAVNVASFAGSEVQPVLEALPVVAPSPSIKEVGFQAAHTAILVSDRPLHISQMRCLKALQHEQSPIGMSCLFPCTNEICNSAKLHWFSV